MNDVIASLIGLFAACALPLGIILGFGIPYLVTAPKRKREDEEHRRRMGWN